MKSCIFVFVLINLFSMPLFAQPLANSQAAADDATRRLEQALNGGSAAGASQNAAVQTARGGTRPQWVNNPYSDYSQSRFLAATGSAKNRSDAEKSAFAALTAFFGQSVKSDLAVFTVYTELFPYRKTPM